MQEFDVLKTAVIFAEGTFIEYSAINISEGALRLGSDEIQVRADGLLVGRLKPGEVLELTEPAQRWEITAANYARVRIGMGWVDSVVQRGVITTDPVLSTIRGNEYVLGTISYGAGLNYCGIVNQTTDRIVTITAFSLFISGSTPCDIRMSYANAPGVNGWTVTADKPMNKHGSIFKNAGGALEPEQNVRGLLGSTVALNPAVDEFTILSDSIMPLSYLGTGQRTFHDSCPTQPWMIPPGTALLWRGCSAGNGVGVRAQLKMLAYGAQ